MCLTVCHKRRLIYDNDRTLVCDGCPFRIRRRNQSCASCNNYIHEKRICKLTGFDIPVQQWCCHYMADSFFDEINVPPQKIFALLLVPPEEYEQALSVYPLPLREEDQKISADEDLFAEQSYPLPVVKNESLLPSSKIDEDGFNLVNSEEMKKRGFVIPVVVGDALLHEENGRRSARQLVIYFRNIYQGGLDIYKDQNGWYAVRMHRFAIPPVYGVPSDKWLQEVRIAYDLESLSRHIIK